MVGYDETDKKWELIAKYSGNISSLADENIEVTELTGGYAILKVPESRIGEISERPEIIYLEKPKRLIFGMDQGKTASCFSPLQMAQYDLKGQGVLVAVLDSGVDYAHPDFRNEDGSTRILALWDQTANREYTREQINEALQAPTLRERYNLLPSRDLSGHGTGVLGIAAGNGRASQGRFVGAAPESEILVVKLGLPGENSFPRTTELMQGVDYVIKKAEACGKPVAINLSFGTVYGGHDGSSLLETFLDSCSGRWKTVILAGTGNEGAAAGHTSGILEEGKRKEIQVGVAEGETSFNIQFWKSYADEAEILIYHPSGSFAGPLRETLGPQRYRLGNTEILAYYGKPSPYNVSQEIYFDFLPTAQFVDSGLWRLVIVPGRCPEGKFHMWLPGEGSLNGDTRFYEPVPDTTLTIPSSARNLIAVGAYDSRLMAYAPFSGRGYTRENVYRKPDLVAPGVEITTTAPGGGYQTVTGTSFAVPFATGAAALLMEWGIVEGNDPFLYGEKVKAYLRRGAGTLQGFTEYPNESVGWGRLCVRDSIPDQGI
jgi:subtilisin family serine protease